MTDPFAFLKAEWAPIHEAAAQAGSTAYHDPRTCCFHARRALELAVEWAYRFDRQLSLPYDTNISALCTLRLFGMPPDRPSSPRRRSSSGWGTTRSTIVRFTRTIR